MTVPEPELQAMLRQAYQLSLGPARFAALDAVFRHADASQNERFAFAARLDAVKDFYYGGDPTRAYLAFSWCLAAYDRDPAQRFDARNANTYQTQRVQRRLSLPAIVENLPLKRLA